MAWEDLCQYYDVIYLSWNPALFPESSCIHRCVGPPARSGVDPGGADACAPLRSGPQ